MQLSDIYLDTLWQVEHSHLCSKRELVHLAHGSGDVELCGELDLVVIGSEIPGFCNMGLYELQGPDLWYQSLSSSRAYSGAASCHFPG